MSCVDKKDANRISASKSGRNPAQRIRPESEEIPTRVQFSPQGGNGTVVGISELSILDKKDVIALAFPG